MTELNAAPAANLSLTLLDGADMTTLFSPVTIAGLRLRNRFVMSPMTRAFSPDGVPGENVAAYYARRAESLGIVMTEGSYVNESAGGFDNVPRLFGDDALAAWRKVTDGVHAVGGFIFSQLWHIGAQRDAGAGPYPDSPMISPSGINCDGQVVGEPATIAQLEETVEDFARAAVFAKAAGFDGVDLHGAHGYLLDQFHWPVTNRRTDAYGGDMAGRVRLSAEIAAAVRAAVGPEFPVDFRFSQWKGNDFDARIAESPSGTRGVPHPARRGGRVHVPRLHPPLLDARLRRLRPHPGRLDQAPERQARHRDRLGGSRRPVHVHHRRRQLGPGAQPVARAARRPGEPGGVRPGGDGPRQPRRPALGRQGVLGPAVRDPPL